MRGFCPELAAAQDRIERASEKMVHASALIEACSQRDESDAIRSRLVDEANAVRDALQCKPGEDVLHVIRATIAGSAYVARLLAEAASDRKLLSKALDEANDALRQIVRERERVVALAKRWQDQGRGLATRELIAALAGPVCAACRPHGSAYCKTTSCGCGCHGKAT